MLILHSTQGNCNFDSLEWLSECNYKVRSDDDLEWQWASGSGQPATGPQHDHTLGSNGTVEGTGHRQHWSYLFFNISLNCDIIYMWGVSVL